MHRYVFFFLFFAFSGSVLQAQSVIERLLQQKRYNDVVAYAEQSAKLSGQDLFFIGQAYIKLKNNEQAVEMLNLAIAKGYKNGEVYYARGIAESNLELYGAAIHSFRQALVFLPNRKKVLIELAAAYYQGQVLDSAYAVYSKIEAGWSDYLPAVLMTCQVLHEQEKYDKTLDCYYNKLHILKKDPYYHKQALESIVRIEWHHFHHYPKTEIAIKNLMNDYPDNFGYTMMLMQLYNYLGRYADATVLEKSLLDAYDGQKLSRSFYRKGAMLVDQFDTAQYQIEVYRNFQPEKNSNCVYKAFVFTAQSARPLGKIEAIQLENEAFVVGYAMDSAAVSAPKLSYEWVKNNVVNALFSPQDSTMLK